VRNDFAHVRDAQEEDEIKGQFQKLSVPGNPN
jgi:hypothetical protein